MTGGPRRALGALAQFFAAEATGALVLLLATAAALVWANLDAPSYERIFTLDLAIDLGDSTLLSLDVRHWIGEGLMALFFFVVGIEIKRELVSGELSDGRRARLPLVAAACGIAAPAAIYLAFTLGTDAARGWGIPVATDIAFAVGVLGLVARGAPSGLRVFLLSVAIVDDIGSIAIIALFYTERIQLVALGVAVLLLGAVVLMWRYPSYASDPPLVILMLGVWAATLASGVHATIAGVTLGLLTPTTARLGPSPAERLQHTLHPWTSYVVVPLFALANAGVRLDAETLGAALSSRVTLGVATGLVAGKILGLGGGAYLAVRTGIAELPGGVRWAQIAGVAALGGIGYTVALFISTLSFRGGLEEEAKVGILIGSLLAAVVAALVFRLGARVRSARAQT